MREKQYNHGSAHGWTIRKEVNAAVIALVALNAEPYFHNQSDMKDSFILYTSQYNQAVRRLTLEQKGRLFDALFLYALGEPVELDDDTILYMAFEFIKNHLDADSAKYKEITEKRRDAGRKGGLKRTENQAKQANQANDILLASKKANQAVSVSDSVSVSVSDINNINHLQADDKSATDVTDPAAPGYAKEILDYFNSKVVEKGSSFNPIKIIQGKRLEKLRARVRQYGIDGVKMVIDKSVISAFMNGANSRGWTATFDWIICPNNFPKVLEGNYDNKESEQEETTNPYPNINWQ